MSPADLASMDRAMERRIDMADFLVHHPEYRPVVDTTRCYPRSVREAFPVAECTENAIEISGPPVQPAPPPLWARLLRPLFVRPERNTP